MTYKMATELPRREPRAGNPLRAARVAHEISQAELAAILMVSTSTIQRWENGSFRIPSRIWPVIERAFDPAYWASHGGSFSGQYIAWWALTRDTDSP
jgi:DNA-binding XRE family transcriptional regulator